MRGRGAHVRRAVSAQLLPSAPPKQFGGSVTPAFEGWFDNPDGTHTFLIGYFNRNTSAEVDIPIGPEQSLRAGRSRPGPADAFPDAAAATACS